MPIGYLCQWISYAVFAVVSACCVPVSHANVLVRSAFRAVRGKVILQAQSKKVLDICRAASFGLAMALLLDESLAPLKEKIGLRADSRILCVSTEGATDLENYRKIIASGGKA